MMRGLILIVLVAGVAGAAPTTLPFDAPADWTDRSLELEPKLANLRSIRGTVSVDGAIYTNPAGDTELSVLSWVSDMSSTPTRKNIEELDRGIVQGSSKAGTGHISDSRHWIGEQLVADQVDDLHGLRFHQHRIHAATSDGLVHTLSVACAGPAASKDPCEAALAKAHLALPDQVSPPAGSDRSAYELGRIVGAIVVAVVVIVLLRRARRQRPS